MPRPDAAFWFQGPGEVAVNVDEDDLVTLIRHRDVTLNMTLFGPASDHLDSVGWNDNYLYEKELSCGDHDRSELRSGRFHRSMRRSSRGSGRAVPSRRR